jgi:hypothetical protein
MEKSTRPDRATRTVTDLDHRHVAQALPVAAFFSLRGEDRSTAMGAEAGRSDRPQLCPAERLLRRKSRRRRVSRVCDGRTHLTSSTSGRWTARGIRTSECGSRGIGTSP